jgi:hypothetical protein
MKSGIGTGLGIVKGDLQSPTVQRYGAGNFCFVARGPHNSRSLGAAGMGGNNKAKSEKSTRGNHYENGGEKL